MTCFGQWDAARVMWGRLPPSVSRFAWWEVRDYVARGVLGKPRPFCSGPWPLTPVSEPRRDEQNRPNEPQPIADVCVSPAKTRRKVQLSSKPINSD